MKENFPNCLKLVLKHEGGYTNHPSDPGGATNQGVIQRVYDSYRRRKGLLPRHVKMLEDSERDEIYKELYWDKINGDNLPLGIDYCVFDGAVNSGPSQSAKWLQRALRKLHPQGNKVVVDGIVGPVTTDFSDDVNPIALIDDILDQRLGFLKVIRSGKLFKVFGNGWMNRLFGYLPKGAKVRRADGVDDYAKAMVQTPTIPVPPSKPKVPLPPVPASRNIGEIIFAIIIGAALALIALWNTLIGG